MDICMYVYEHGNLAKLTLGFYIILIKIEKILK